MQNAHPVYLLMFFTFAVVVVVAIVMMMRFVRKRENRHPMAGQRERNIDEIHRDSSVED